MESLHPYIPVGMIIVLGLGFGAVNLLLGRLIGPRSTNPSKELAYESGMEPFHEANLRVPIKFYMIAILFLLFDIETIFILAWAVVFRGRQFDFESGAYGFTADAFRRFAFLEMSVFLAILLLGYAYAWKKGALEWS